MKILCTGDIHIGRRSSRIPGRLDPDGLHYTCAAAWDAVVDLAVGQSVDLVAISGDLVDQENRYYEAVGAVERGLRRLATAGIDTVAVAGNHDWDVLPRLVDGVDHAGFHLLGRGGRWERETFRRDGRTVLHVDGWSFAQRHVDANALADFLAPPGDGAPVLGLLHADLTGLESRYNPVALNELQRMRVDFWLLGHIHRPRWIPPHGGGPGVLYPGSPHALDPGDDGIHGAWIVEIAPGRENSPRRIPLSPVRYIEHRIDLTGIDTKDDLDPHIALSIRASLAETVSGLDAGPLGCVCYRVVLGGRTLLHSGLRALLPSIREGLNLSSGSACAVIDSIHLETRPPIELASLAARPDPPGELARLLLALESNTTDDSPEYQELLTTTVNALRKIHRSGAYQDIGEDPEPDLEAARTHLRTEGWLLLDAVLAQKESL